MDLNKLARVQDSYSSRAEALLKFKKLNSEEYKTLLKGFSMDNVPVNIIDEKGKMLSYDGEYQTSKVEIGELTFYLSIQTIAYLDKGTGEITVDVDDITGAVRNDESENVGGEDLFFSLIDNIEDDLKEDIEEMFKKRLMKDNQYKKFLKKGKKTSIKDSEEFHITVDENPESFDDLVSNFEKVLSQMRPKFLGNRLVIPSASFLDKVKRAAENLGCEVTPFEEFTVISEPDYISDSNKIVDSTVKASGIDIETSKIEVELVENEPSDRIEFIRCLEDLHYSEVENDVIEEAKDVKFGLTYSDRSVILDEEDYLVEFYLTSKGKLLYKVEKCDKIEVVESIAEALSAKIEKVLEILRFVTEKLNEKVGDKGWSYIIQESYYPHWITLNSKEKLSKEEEEKVDDLLDELEGHLSRGENAGEDQLEGHLIMYSEHPVK